MGTRVKLAEDLRGLPAVYEEIARRAETEKNKDLAAEYGVSPGRISQIKKAARAKAASAQLERDFGAGST